MFVEPFFTTKYRHRGLSLAVVYRMLYAHRGGVQADARPGQGTIVRLCSPWRRPECLPWNQVALVEAPCHDRSHPRPAGRGEPPRRPGLPGAGLADFQAAGEIRILILDDDPSVCTFIRRACSATTGFMIDTLSDPSQVEGWLKGQGTTT